MRTVLRGGTVVNPDEAVVADVAIDGDVITEVVTAIGDIPPGEKEVDCRGRLVMPGFIDAHSHADGLLADDAVQSALLAQGVTSVITGQDGVSYAPGDGAYANEYFAAINGEHPNYTGGGVGAYLAAADGTSRLNAAYLVPAGTVRWEACGRSAEPAGHAEREAMTGLVESGMNDGAVGLSTGLDYVPGLFQDAAEIAALCRPVAAAGGVYVSHMRGGYESGSDAGIAEIARIAADTSVPVHVSHFHAEPDIVLEQLDRLERAGIDATFDAYPYTRGCSLLSMPLLPSQLSRKPADDVVAALTDPSERDRLRREWFPEVSKNPSLGPDWPDMITLAHVDSADYAWACGLTIADASARVGTDAIDFALDVLAASRTRANMVMAVPYDRTVADLARIFAHPAHMGGSDGIFIGRHPHPRARGTFSRFLREYVRETSTWSWSDAVFHLSTAPAKRFGLGRRGRVAPEWSADVIVVDPERVADRATYDRPLEEACGIDDVFVAGAPVLAGGRMTRHLPGQGLRRRTA